MIHPERAALLEHLDITRLIIDDCAIRGGIWLHAGMLEANNVFPVEREFFKITSGIEHSRAQVPPRRRAFQRSDCHLHVLSRFDAACDRSVAPTDFIQREFNSFCIYLD